MSAEKWILQKPIAHRGLHGEGRPENSIPAFEAAVESGVAIELDVQLTKDGRAVVFHDDNLIRMTGKDKELSKTTVEELKKLKLGNTNFSIPTFDEVLEIVAGKVPLLVEIKKHKKALEKIVVEKLQNYTGDYAVQAFNPLAIRSIKKFNSSIFCGLLSAKFDDMKLLRIKKAAIKNARLFFMAKPDFLSFEVHSFPNERIARFRKELGIPVLTWTVRTQEEKERAKVFADNIIFENLSVISG